MTEHVGRRSGFWFGFTFGLGLLVIFGLAAGVFAAAGGARIVAGALDAVQSERRNLYEEARTSLDRIRALQAEDLQELQRTPPPK